jgi:2-keto-4-pentenoate hydratase
LTADRIERAARALVEARRTRDWPADLPADCRPATVEEAYAVQEAVARTLGRIGGWKVGAPTPTAEPRRAPLLAALVAPGPATLRGPEFHLIGIEAELAFRVGHDLPRRDAPYGRDEVLDALDTMHPAIEVVDSRFADRTAADPLSQLADNIGNGAFVYGPGLNAWRHLDLARQPVRLTIDGALVYEGKGGNTAGDPLRLVHWLANDLAARGGGLRAGDVVTTGTTTGLRFVEPGAVVEAEFPGLGSVRVEFTR